VPDPIDGALKGTDSRKNFRPETHTAIELAQQMFVTKADFVCDLPDAERIAAAPDDLQRITNRAWWLGPSAHPLQQPCFDQGEARFVIERFTEIIAQPADLAAEDGIQFHDAAGKLAKRHT
jgi:hypothetical protein